MGEHTERQVLTDDAVKAIMLARGTLVEIAEKVGCSPRMVQHYRSRSSYRAIRIATELGIISRRKGRP